MNDNSEQVVLELDESQVIQGTARGNAALDSYGKKAVQSIGEAGRAFESHGGLVVRTSDRTRNSVERLVASSEKLAQTYGKSGVEKLVGQRDQLIQRLGNEAAAVDRVRASYDKMIATERAAEAQATATAARMASRTSQLQAQAASASSGKSLIGNIQNFAQDPIGALRTNALDAAGAMGPLGAALAGTAIAIGGVALATFEAAKSLGEYAINVENAATRTGLTTREVAQFGFAANLVGQDIGAFEHGMRGLTAAMTDNSAAGAKAREKLHDIGVVPRELNGEIKATGPLLMQISEALNRLPNVWERNAAGAEIFKKAWIELGPAILKLSGGVNLAISAGVTGSSEAEIQHYIANLERIEIAEKKWEMFFRTFKAGLVDMVEFIAKNGIPGVMGPILGPDAPPFKPPGDHSWAAKQEALAAQRSRNEGNALLDAARARMSTTPEGLKAREAEAHQKYEEAYKNIQTLSDIGAEAAQKEVQKVAELGVTYRRLSDQVKEIEKDEAKRIGNLEKIRDLVREGQSAYVIGTGAMQTVVSGQQVFDANRPPRGIPSLYGRGSSNPYDALIPIPMEQDEKPGLQVLHGEAVFISPASARQTEAPFEAARAKAFGADLDERRKHQDEIRLAGINAETSATIRLLELRTDPGGEVETAHQVAALRQSALEQEYQLTDNIVRYRESSLQNELDLRLKLAELQHKQVDEIKSVASGLFDTLFTKPAEFGKQLLSTVKAALLKPITEGLADITANILHPVIFGKDGNGGISGALHGIFGGGNHGINDVQLVNGAVPVVVMGAGSSGASSGGSSSAASTFGRLTRMGLGGALAGALAMGGTPRMSGGEVIGGGDSTAGLTQLTSGLWQRGPGARMSDIGPGGTPPFIGGTGDGGGWGGGGGAAPGGGGSGRGNPLSGILGNLKGIDWGGFSRADAGGTPGVNGQPGTDLGNSGKITGMSGVAGAALMAGGMMLAQHGLLGGNRGTWAGVGEGALGGAMVGMTLGGPLGAAIGGGVGLLVGLGEKIAGVETPEREAARLIKSIYGLNIDSSSTTIKQVIAMAQQSYGGRISIAVRSPQVRDLLQLYADSTGQKSSMFADVVHPASLVQSGGSLYQTATYRNGTPYTYASPLPTLGPSGGIIPTSNPLMNGATSIHLNPQQTVDLWQTGTTQAIAGNPRGVAQAAGSGNAQTAARLNSAGLSFDPGAIWA